MKRGNKHFIVVGLPSRVADSTKFAIEFSVRKVFRFSMFLSVYPIEWGLPAAIEGVDMSVCMCVWGRERKIKRESSQAVYSNETLMVIL